MELRKKIKFLLFFAVLCFSALTFQDTCEAKPKLTIAITNGKVSGTQKFVKKYNQDASAKYTIKLVVIKKVKKNFSTKKYDGLIIPGGNHVNPKRYGEKRRCPYKATGSHKYNNSLDALDLAAVKAFVKAKKPVLGICRGCQLVNVYFKGKLNQNIGKTHYKGAWLRVKTVAGSDMEKVFGRSVLSWHWHHQAVKKLGKDLVATMVGSDGIVEGFKHRTLPVLGVQWHPEQMYYFPTKSRSSFKTEQEYVNYNNNILEGQKIGKQYLEYFFTLCENKRYK